jgi:hypothetical protein
VPLDGVLAWIYGLGGVYLGTFAWGSVQFQILFERADIFICCLSTSGDVFLHLAFLGAEGA